MGSIRLCHLLVAITCLAGCFQQLQVIKFRPDGSGTLEVTVAVNRKMAAMMGVPTKPTPLPGGELQKLEDEIKLSASRYGDVTLLSTELIDTAEHVGVRASYGFKDINKVKLREAPDPPLPQIGGPKTQEPTESVSFRFATERDGTKVLTVVSPDWSADKNRNRPTKKANYRDTAEMKEIFSGMKLAGWIEVEGTVVKTNSPHREGSKVILYEFDFDQILTDPQGFNKLMEANLESLQEAKRSLGNIKGVKIGFEPEIIIEFK
jgi:hypothetical protein